MNRGLLPASGTALDVACGRGRNAIWLAEQGFDTTAVDRDAAAIAALNERARQQALPLRARVMDLESAPPPLGDAAYDVIVVTHYLHRPLFPSLLAALRPGGTLVYETFLRAQAARGRPTNPDFLLEPGELRRLVAPLDVRAAREGDFEGRLVSGVVAVKTGAGLKTAATLLAEVRRERAGHGNGRDAEVRRAPDDLAVANEQRLRRFVADAEPRAHGVRHLAVRLHRHHRVIGLLAPRRVEVLDQLVERFGARAARVAVLEEQHGTAGGVVEQPVEIAHVPQGFQVGAHRSCDRISAPVSMRA